MKCHLCDNTIHPSESTVPMGFVRLIEATGEMESSMGEVHKRCIMIAVLGEAKADQLIKESQARFN